MKVFPENITRALFATSWDGRLTTEAQLLVQRAQSLLQDGRNTEDADDIRKAIRVLIIYTGLQGWPKSAVLPIAGILAGAADRRSLYTWFNRTLMIWAGRVLEVLAKRVHGMDDDAPGWNDYVMAYWMMTGDPDAVEELYYRATDPVKDPALLPAKESAEWMVASVRKDCAEFDRAYSEVEASAADVEKALA